MNILMVVLASYAILGLITGMIVALYYFVVTNSIDRRCGYVGWNYFWGTVGLACAIGLVAALIFPWVWFKFVCSTCNW